MPLNRFSAGEPAAGSGPIVFVGGLKYKRQEFNIHDARHNSGLLIFAIIVAFVIPEVFSVGMGNASKLNLSIGISIIMILLYVAALYFKLVTHRGVYQPNNAAQTEEEGRAGMVREGCDDCLVCGNDCGGIHIRKPGPYLSLGG